MMCDFISTFHAIFLHECLIHYLILIAIAGGGGGRSKKDTAGCRIDDGSMYGDGAVYDNRDPNYDSEEETPEEKIKYVPPAVLRRAVGNASMTLTKYKVSNYFTISFSCSHTHSENCRAYY